VKEWFYKKMKSEEMQKLLGLLPFQQLKSRTNTFHQRSEIKHDEGNLIQPVPAQPWGPSPFPENSKHSLLPLPGRMSEWAVFAGQTC
jgi:hypothetical protein